MENSKSRFVQIIKEIAAEDHLLLESYAYDWVFRLGDKNGKHMIINGYHFPCNNLSSAGLCDDKSAASEMMERYQIPHVPHRFFLSPSDVHYVGAQGDENEMLRQFHLWGDCVAKPNFGTGGYQVCHVHTEKQLLQAAKSIFSSSGSLALSPYQKIENEYRVIMLGGEMRLVFEKQRPNVIGDGLRTLRALTKERKVDTEMDPDYVPCEGEKVYIGWKHNLGQGSVPREVDSAKIRHKVVLLAEQVMSLFELVFASVDIVYTGGEFKVLEVNSGVMLEHFAASGEAHYLKAKDIYRDAIRMCLS